MKTLRYVRMVTGPGEVYTLHTWDTGKRHDRGDFIAYEFSRNGNVLFARDDFICPFLYYINSDDCLCLLLSCITRIPNNFYREHFDNYTADQMRFAVFDAEHLEGWVDGNEVFEEIDG